MMLRDALVIYVLRAISSYLKAPCNLADPSTKLLAIPFPSARAVPVQAMCHQALYRTASVLDRAAKHLRSVQEVPWMGLGQL